MTKFAIAAVSAAMLSVAGGPAMAHHSFAMFDREKEVTLQGSIKEFQFANPHAWIQIVAPAAQGGQVEWGIECGAPAMMIRTGWKSTTLKPGDKVTLHAHPRKDGQPSASLISITLADGKVLGPGGPPPRPVNPAPPPA